MCCTTKEVRLQSKWYEVYILSWRTETAYARSWLKLEVLFSEADVVIELYIDVYAIEKLYILLAHCVVEDDDTLCWREAI